MELSAFLSVAALLFVIGLVMVVSRRNLIYVLMGLELILNAANINLVAFNRFNPDATNLDGHLAAVFVIILAAAEAAIALAIVLNVHSLFDTVKPDDIDRMKD